MARMGVYDAITTLSRCLLVPYAVSLANKPNLWVALSELASTARETPVTAWHDATHTMRDTLAAWPAKAIELDLAKANAALDAIGEAAEEYGIRWWEIPPG